jgi:hypothetical protein
MAKNLISGAPTTANTKEATQSQVTLKSYKFLQMS